MVSPVNASTGKGINFSLFGFPVTIDFSFFMIGLLIGFQAGDIKWVAMFLLVIAVSVLVHELGHAFAARALGARPTIRLHFMGGVTMFSPPTPPTRLQSIGVSLAGPFAGFALGIIVLLARQAVEDPVAGSLADNAWRFLLLINIGWGAVNLAPVLPLDGGHVMENLLPGNDLQRRRIASMVSVVVGGALALFFWRQQSDYRIAAFLFGLFAVQNVSGISATSKKTTQKWDDRDELEASIKALNSGSTTALGDLERLAGESADPVVQKFAKMLVIERLVTTGQVAEGRQRLDDLPGQVHPALYGLVALYEGSPSAIEQIEDAMRAEPTPAAARVLALGYVGAGRVQEIPAVLGAGPPSYRQPEVLRSVQHTLHGKGFYEPGVQVGELHIASLPSADGQVFYNTACGWARLNNTERAYNRLDTAIERGWNDRETLDTDPDFAPYRHQVEFGALRGKIGR